MARRASHGRGGFWRTDWAVGAVLRSACARARLREDRSSERNVGERAVCLCEDLIRAASAAEASAVTKQSAFALLRRAINAHAWLTNRSLSGAVAVGPVGRAGDRALAPRLSWLFRRVVSPGSRESAGPPGSRRS